jgi:hypothetical protein
MDMNDDHDQSHEAKARRLRTALDLADAGIAMKRMQFRRTYPEETSEEIDRRLNLWLRDRPYDAPGRVVDGSKYLGE